MPRVGQKKSRPSRGCKRCKQRKVKCDETLPSCAWCRSHSLPCQYEVQHDSSASSTAQVPSPASSVTTNQSLDFHFHLDNDRQHLLELGLFQYYMFTLTKTFPYIDEERDRGLEIHMNMIPQEALRSSSLRSTMHAWTLLHIHLQKSLHGKVPRNVSFFESLGIQFAEDQDRTGNNKQSNSSPPIKLLDLHRYYLDHAIQLQHDAISSINKDNADGICLTAVLIAMIALIHSTQITPKDSTASYQIPLNWFYLQRFFTACLDASYPILTMDSATNALIHSKPQIDSRNLTPPTSGVFINLLHLQPNSESATEILDEQTEEAYGIALAYIQTIYQRVSQNEAWQALGRRILAFPTLVPAKFVTFLEESRPRALVMLAHLLALSKKLDRTWWAFKGVADHHVRGIASILPDEWQSAMAWPLKVLERGVDTPV